MNSTQHRRFLWEWSRRRERWRGNVLLMGLGLGALAGVGFALALWAATPGMRLNEEEIGPWLMVLARAMGPVGFLFFISVLAFGALGVFLSMRVWSMQEGMYHDLIRQGVRIPFDEPPPLTWKDRAPGLIVLGVLVLGAIWLVVMMVREVRGDN